MSILPSSRSRGILLLAVLLSLAILLGWAVTRGEAQAPIRVGVLHSLSGSMAVSGKPLVDAVRLAVEEINARGGLLGREIEMVVADGRSDPKTFAAEAERLIGEEKVSVLFACWSSACRDAVRPVVERHQNLMFYALRYEGLEDSSHIVYTGSAPNQQIIPGARWAMEKLGRRIYLLGSGDVFPYAANQMIRDLVTVNGGEILGERYVTEGGTELAQIVADIRAKKPDVVFNTLFGDTNAALFAALAQSGLGNVPLVSFSLAEPEMKAFGGGRLGEHYAVWSYFQSVPREENRRFVAAYKARFGADRVTSDPIEASYVGVHLWAQAVQAVGSADPRRVNSATLLRQSFNGPSEVTAVDTRTRHLWKMVRVGKVQPDGQFEQVIVSSGPIRPEPWPFYRSREQWQALIVGSLENP